MASEIIVFLSANVETIQILIPKHAMVLLIFF